jgi:hypothetical protein
MALMSVDEARALGDELRSQFSSPDAFETSWRRCFEKLKTPSAESAKRWLLEDLKADGVMSAGLPPREPLLPVRQSYDLSECRHCAGLRYVRADVPVGHRDFGRAIPCQFCADPAHKTSCEICSKPPVLSGYFGPETSSISVGAAEVPPTISEHHELRRPARRRHAAEAIPQEVWDDLERMAAEKAERQKVTEVESAASQRVD